MWRLPILPSIMMPWEHAIIGYIGYSLFVHAVYRDSPTGTETIVVVLASILPDIIDKPLAWEFGVFSSGRALAHSVFFAIPLSLLILVLAYRSDRKRLGWAFSIGYLLHLPADVVPAYFRNGRFPLDRVIWPFRSESESSSDGFGESFRENFLEYAAWGVNQIRSGDPDTYFLLLLTVGLAGFLLWIYDGMPVARDVYLGSKRGIVNITERITQR